MHIVIKDGFYTGLDILHPIVPFNGPGHLGTLQLIPPVNTIVPPLTKCAVLILSSLIVQFVLFILLLSDSITFMRCYWVVHKYYTFYLYFFVFVEVTGHTTFLNAKLSPYELSQNSQAMIIQDVFFSC